MRDVTGAIVARAVDASIYENWTDVSGFLVADPRIVKNPEVIETITYKELRELAYMGASVLHEDAIPPLGRPPMEGPVTAGCGHDALSCFSGEGVEEGARRRISMAALPPKKRKRQPAEKTRPEKRRRPVVK